MMSRKTVLTVPRSEAIRYAGKFLADSGLSVTQKCGPDVTHVLLPVPSFVQGDTYLAHLLTELPDQVIICGGNLHSPLVEGYPIIDFLQDPYYLADNAAITAECTIKMLKEQFLIDLERKKVLVIGWGRIGKCLCPMLQTEGANVSVTARNPHDLAMIHALGYQAIPISETSRETVRFDVILNTVPELLFPQIPLKEDCVALELASKPGMTGQKIIDARGLPGKLAPKKSGKLIAETFLRFSI